MKKIALLTILFFAAYVGLQAQSSTWNTLGNSFPFFNQNTYFLGTTTEYPLLFRTNNEDRMYISTTGNVGHRHRQPAGEIGGERRDERPPVGKGGGTHTLRH